MSSALNEMVERSAATLLTSGRRPKIAVLLGSGWAPFADRVVDPIVVPYAQMPAFPAPGVEGHAGRVVHMDTRDRPANCNRPRDLAHALGVEIP